MENRGILKLKTEGNFAKQKTRDLIFYVCMVTIPCLQFLVFWVGTNIETILLAFQSYDFIAGDYYFAGMSNFVSVFDTLVKTTDLTKSIINGLIPQLLSYVITWPLSLLFSFYIYKKRFGSDAFRSLIMLPSLVGGVAMTIISIYLFENYIPEIWLKMFGSPIVSSGGLLSNSGTVYWTIVINGLWFAYGTSLLFYSSSMSQVDQSLVESAQLDGATNIQEMIYIILPSLWPMLVVFLSSGVCSFLTTDLGLYAYFELDAPIEARTLGYYITQKTLQGGVASYPACSALSLLITVVAVPLTLLARGLLIKFGPSEE